MAERWKIRPEGSNWGAFGADDQRGRLNLLTPAVVRRAVQEVVEGRVFCLSLPLDLPGKNVLNPRRFPPRIEYSMRGDDPVINYPVGLVNPGQADVVCDDKVTLSTQYSTQWDSLAHIGSVFDAQDTGKPQVVYYNGFRANEDVRGPFDYLDGRKPQDGPYGLRALGIENMAAAGVQGRGVMLDLFAHFGDTWRAIGYDDVMRVIEADKLEILHGDILCVRTGFDRVLIGCAGDPPPGVASSVGVGLDGSDERLLRWIDDAGIAAIACDNEGVEILPCVTPSKHGSHFPLHEHCLFKLGIHLGEMFHLSDLADWLRAHQRSAFLLTAPPLRLPGAAGSPVTPIATV
ncbi:cyclase family protein [Variovorax ginsengisoli]|uniref:Cyclase family protein n=1 Tax=Variovorax ginsengisoli TaxID=363844 RepID=A0ABT8S9K9_9BURK|nr:cyclase family protein [Variovorax ginsengisoli]MDN8616434.1 cyclase family protein [Variovorax ginsengisoli]MDO1535604.1 cyclase family protein [Variovorax ginsengisoli]